MYTSLQEYKELFTILITRYLQHKHKYQFMVSEALDNPELLQGQSIQGFHCVNLDLKDLMSAELFLRNIDLQ